MLDTIAIFAFYPRYEKSDIGSFV